MHPESLFAVRHWKLPEILFVGAACFAMAAIGFFIAVFVQLHLSPNTTTPEPMTSSQLVPIEDKAKYLEDMSKNSPQPPAPTGRNQADESDPLAAKKLQLLNAMNGQ
jgi:hypothetical protein